jgi:TRAP-type C4-dicarboxylate transport system permease small subunit
MRQLVKRLVWLINGLSFLTGWVAAICIVAAAFIVTEGVVVRKVFGVSTIWQIEASVFLLIFAVFVGAPFVQRKEHHLNVDLVIIHLSPRVRSVVLIIVSILACVLVVILAWYSWPMWWESVKYKEHSESLWGPPLWIPYLFLPLGMTLLFLQYLVYIGEKIAGLLKGKISEEVERSELRGLDIPDGKAETGDPEKDNREESPIE